MSEISQEKTADKIGLREASKPENGGKFDNTESLPTYDTYSTHLEAIKMFVCVRKRERATNRERERGGMCAFARACASMHVSAEGNVALTCV